MITLIIDNYDSFTFNLYQLIAEINGAPPLVLKNDALSWEQIEKLDYDNIVISPGPGNPENNEDFGVCKDAILYSNKPIMGVCLGHQGIAHLFDGKVKQANIVMHGRSSDIYHTGQDIFKNIPSPFSAVRYHSLYVENPGEGMETIARTDIGMSMGAKHKNRPIWSVQFHPESIKSQYGHEIFMNFRNLTISYMKSNEFQFDNSIKPFRDQTYTPFGFKRQSKFSEKFKIYFRRIPLPLNAEDVFMSLYAHSSHSFWLDSALIRGFSRFSYMGDTSGPHSEFLQYNVHKKEIHITNLQGDQKVIHESIFDYLDKALTEKHIETEGIPFDFNLGYAGYFGYEMKGDCGYKNPHQADTPDAAFIFCDRLIVFDHEESMVYLVCMDDVDNTDRPQRWLNETKAKLEQIVPAPQIVFTPDNESIRQHYKNNKQQYIGLIHEVKSQIKLGETYETCLTNMISLEAKIDPINTYRALRKSNPAPYATFLKFGDLSVLGSSPERFITIDPNGLIESKPIKGTRKRGQTIEEDESLYTDLMSNEKDRSENLMIVDLLRNDIGKVSDVGSVHTSSIFSVESYATVHQLVSTIRGKLRKDASVIDCIKSCFPGGSMTGAPKKRSMEIIDSLEDDARGIYSGSIGFLGLNGSADLSIVIRTLVAYGNKITLGVGGAIIDLSDPEDEVNEMLLKSKAPINALMQTNFEHSDGTFNDNLYEMVD